MRVALDAQLLVGTATGIGEYVRGLAQSLPSSGIDVIELRDERLDPWRFDRRFVWDQIVLPRRAERSGATLLHCASGTMPLRCALPAVVTVHDVAWLRVQGHAPWYARQYFGRFALKRYRSASAVLVDSAFSRDELLAVLPQLDRQRVHVVWPGVAREFASLQRSPDRQTILVTGTVEPRKNLAHVIGLLPRLRGARIVSVGPPSPYLDECRALARQIGVDSRVEYRGYVPREALLDLYARCAVAAVPSLYEGFGYAVAQALCAGVPCVASDRASLPEVAAADARVIALDDEAAWVQALTAACEGSYDAAAAGARARSAERFSWERAAGAVAGVYRRAVLVDG